MSLNNSQLHGFAFAGTLVLAGSLFGATLYMTEAVEPEHVPALKEMMTIEASLARKSEKKQQPQKEAKAPEPPPPPEPPKPEPEPKAPEPPPPPPEGVSRNENKKPVDKPKLPERKPVKPPKPDDKPVDLSKFKHASDDDPQPGAKPTTDIGQFDGSEKGFAPVNTGDPYWRNLVADFRQVWELPTISKVDSGHLPIGCFHIEADGKIAGVRFDAPSGDETLDDSVQRAMNATKKTRNDKPQPVPTEQLGVIRKWVCFRFTP
jgi:outer membrane biosynthesis protein TonB